jgi:vitamin B12 transporter
MVNEWTMVNYRRPGGLFIFLGNVLVLCGVLGTSRLAMAQTDSTRALREVKVTATSLLYTEAITPVQEVTFKDFKKSNSYNVAEAIRNFSGVNVKDYGGIGGLKTVSVRSLGANHTGVQYDGVPVTDAQNGQIDLGKIGLDNVQSITLHNGQPGEICQPARSFATASLLVINSGVPRFSEGKNSKTTVAFHTGSFGLVNPSLQWQHRLSERWSVRYAGNYQKAHGRYKFKVDGDGSDTLSVRRNAGIQTIQNDAALFWAKSDSNRFYIRANYFHSDRGLPGAVIFYNPISNQHLWNRDLFVQSSYSHKWDKINFLTSAKFSNNYTRYLDPDILNSAGKLDQRYRQKEYYASASVSYQIHRLWTVGYSSDLSITTLHTDTYNSTYPKRYTYLNVLSSLFKYRSLEVQGSLLQTTIREAVTSGAGAPDRSAWSPSLSLAIHPFQNRDFLLRAFYKDIFRNPTFNDLYYARLGSRSLKPEYARQYNVGATYGKNFHRAVDYLTVTVDAYYNYVKDKIVAVPNKDLFSWSMLNLGKVDVMGVDVGLKTRIRTIGRTKLVAAGNYTYQQALDVTDPRSSSYQDQIPYTPRHSLALNVGLDHPRWGLFFNQTYSAHRYYLAENRPDYYVPGFYISDCSALYRWALGGLDVSTSVEVSNLFNQSYAIIRSYPMPGRSYRFSIQLSF